MFGIGRRTGQFTGNVKRAARALVSTWYVHRNQPAKPIKGVRKHVACKTLQSDWCYGTHGRLYYPKLLGTSTTGYSHVFKHRNVEHTHVLPEDRMKQIKRVLTGCLASTEQPILGRPQILTRSRSRNAALFTSLVVSARSVYPEIAKLFLRASTRSLSLLTSLGICML